MGALIVLASGSAFLCRVAPFLLARLRLRQCDNSMLKRVLDTASQAMLGMLAVQLLPAQMEQVSATILGPMAIFAGAFVLVARGASSTLCWAAGVGAYGCLRTLGVA